MNCIMVNAITTSSKSAIKIINSNKVAQFARNYWWAIVPLACIGVGFTIYAIHYKQVSSKIPSSFQTALNNADIDTITAYLADAQDVIGKITLARQGGNAHLIYLYQATQNLPLNQANQILQQLADSMVIGDSYQEYVIAMQYLDIQSFDAYFIGKCPLDRLKRGVKEKELQLLINIDKLAQRIKNRSFKTDGFSDDLALLLLLGQTAPEGIDSKYKESAEAAIATRSS